MQVSINSSTEWGSAFARAGWSIGFGPRIPSSNYVYATIFNYGGPHDSSSMHGDSYLRAEASADVYHGGQGCEMQAYASVNPLCHAPASISVWGVCPQTGTIPH
jgi:hypothetical protein